MKCIVLSWLYLIIAIALLSGWLYVGYLHAASAAIKAAPDGETFSVTFEPGAIWACTVFQMQKATEPPSSYFPDGKYAPRHCWGLSPAVGFYEDNWDHIPPYGEDWLVWAEIQRPGASEFVSEETNRLSIHR